LVSFGNFRNKILEIIFLIYDHKIQLDQASLRTFSSAASLIK